MKALSKALAGALVILVGTSCAVDDGVGGVSAPLRDVSFINAVNVTVTGNSIVKTGVAGWNAGALGLQNLQGDGYVEFSTDEHNMLKMVGLSFGDTDQSFEDIDFAIYLKKGKEFSVYENGVYRGDFGMYRKNDLFRIEVAQGDVHYYHEGVLFYTSAAHPTFPLRIDTALYSVGSTITDVVIEEGLFWNGATGVDVTNNSILKTTPDGWDAGASSGAELHGNGYVEWTAGERSNGKMAGLSNGDTDTSFADIDFAFYLKKGGDLLIYESGTNLGLFGTYVAGDLFQVEVVDGVVQYRQNGGLLYTSLVAPTFPLILDTALHGNGALIVNAHTQRDAVFVDGVGVSTTGADLVKTGPDGWDAGARSSRSLLGDGAVEFVARERKTYRMAGLSNGDTDQSFEDIDFAIYLVKGGDVRIREAGVNLGVFGTYAKGDVFRIEVTGTQVRYLQNGTPFYTSLNTATLPLLFDTSLYTSGATIENLRFF